MEEKGKFFLQGNKIPCPDRSLGCFWSQLYFVYAQHESIHDLTLGSFQKLRLFCIGFFKIAIFA